MCTCDRVDDTSTQSASVCDGVSDSDMSARLSGVNLGVCMCQVSVWVGGDGPGGPTGALTRMDG